MRLRLATPADLPAMLAIYRPHVESGTASFEYETPSPAAFSARFEAITADFPWYAAEEDGVVAGFAYASRPFARAAYQWDAELSVYVADAYRGRGVGRALYARLERDLAAMGYVNVYAIITKENTASIAFHERLGYRFMAEMPDAGYKFGRWLSVVWYAKALRGGRDPGPAPVRFRDMERQEEPIMFVSNTPTSTSHNSRIVLNRGETRTFRVLLRPIEAGPFLWRFRFSNCIDSTWDDGSESWADLPGGRLAIVSAGACAEADGAMGEPMPVTWGGAAGREVGPCEWAVSDAVALDIPRGGHIAFTWCLRALEDGAILPATPDSRALCYSAPGEATAAPMAAFQEDDLACLPDAFEANRPVSARMVFMGDSITQGVQTQMDACEQWAARIALGLGREAAAWNIGLGYGRAADAAKNGAWLGKAAGADIVNLCFGVNDLLHGSRDADVLAADLRAAIACLKARNPRAKAVLFTIPPFDLTGEDEARWRAVNALIRGGDHLGADAVFDIACVLGCEAPKDNMAFFGGHPDGRGGAAVAGEYLSAFWPAARHELMPGGGV